MLPVRYCVLVALICVGVRSAELPEGTKLVLNPVILSKSHKVQTSKIAYKPSEHIGANKEEKHQSADGLGASIEKLLRIPKNLLNQVRSSSNAVKSQRAADKQNKEAIAAAATLLSQISLKPASAEKKKLVLKNRRAGAGQTKKASVATIESYDNQDAYGGDVVGHFVAESSAGNGQSNVDYSGQAEQLINEGDLNLRDEGGHQAYNSPQKGAHAAGGDTYADPGYYADSSYGAIGNVDSYGGLGGGLLNAGGLLNGAGGIFKGLGILLPIGLLLAALPPNIINVAVNSATAGRRRRRSVVAEEDEGYFSEVPSLRSAAEHTLESPAAGESVLKLGQNGLLEETFETWPVLDLIDGYGITAVLTDTGCQRRVLCEIAQLGRMPEGNAVQRSLWAAVNTLPRSLADSYMDRTLLAKMSEGECTFFHCTKRVEFPSGTEKP